MKTPFAADARFEAGPEFAPASAGGVDFLVGPGGDRVRIDGLGRRLWAALPGTRDELAAKLNAELALGGDVLDDFLLLFVKAGLIRCLSEGGQAEDCRRGSGAESGPLVSAVSAVIVTRNGAAHIRACLDSLARQNYRPFEILVVDNGSIDGTAEIIRREYAAVRVLDPGKNLYYPGGLNYGLWRAQGEFVLVLNDDVELASDVIGRLAARMIQDASAAAVVPQLRLFNLRGFLNGIGNHVRETGWGSDNFVGCVDVGQFRDLREVPSACVSAALIRKSAWKAVEPFDAGYLAYYEDVDWSFRARLAGWKIGAEPEAIVYHKFSAYWKNMEGKLRLAARNRMRFVLRIFRGPSFWIYLKSYLKEDLINMLSLLRRRRYAMVWAYLRAYGGLVLHLPGIVDSRRRIAAKRVGGVTIEDILALNPEHWTCMGPEGAPVLDAETYFGYYRDAIRRGRYSPDVFMHGRVRRNLTPGQSPGPPPPCLGRARLSVVIVTWNSGAFLRKCLESIRREGGEIPCEIVVVDNGSEDGTVEMLRSSFPDVFVIRNKANLGFVKGCNQGLRRFLSEGTSRYVALVNSDVVIKDRALEKMARFLEAHPEAAAVGPVLILPDGSLQPGPAGFRPTALSAAIHYTFLAKAWPRIRRTLFIDPGGVARGGAPHRVDWISGACLMVRRTAVERAGLMNEDYFLYADDLEWGGRMTDCGLGLFYLPRIAVEHYHGMTEKVILKRNNTRWLACLFRYVGLTRGTGGYILFRLAAAAGFALRVVLQGGAAAIGRRPGSWAKAAEAARYLGFSLAGRARTLQ